MLDDGEYDELREACEIAFDFQVLSASPIVRGWLNRKWELETTKGKFLLKSYHPDRFRLYNEHALARALRWQSDLQQLGLPCPQILMDRGEPIHRSPSGHRFVLMTFSDGHRLIPGRATVGEMYSLGRATGRMHGLLNLQAGPATRPQFSIPAKGDRISHWRELYAAIRHSGHEEILPFVERQLKATEGISTSDFLGADVGWAHRDLWADNILMSDGQLSAILDFDRLNSDYLELDVARAILSGALDGDELNARTLNAFLDGYRSERAFPKGRILRALRLVWYMESSWWITQDMDKHTVPPQRFAHEMDWMARNLDALPSLVGML